LKSARIASGEAAYFCAAIAGRVNGMVPTAAAAPVKNPRRELTISPQSDPRSSDQLKISLRLLVILTVS
jgi:hypothetical protein